ncbi:tRNA 5-hydroxyuridine modification protein YegQ [Gallaecimonas kandeliae]|uniref:prephenate-dependent tRNA uridine(34) hydroxylase TrhP n=1 Tax=Gallaecimonas kandeliae TaxID=3029055 RepID=UPI00264840E8|nr:tRNA 5-hydroxyuridine modification protein YegQ [Gallaecimonas kandeliae]WKE66362.1 tRNA 5-hydroxyuridine modification protein YegQ [Gallaecimonas kandeliae]
MTAPELLCPAGSLKHLEYAFAYGADAVYAGLPRYSLRVRNNSFNAHNLKAGIDRAHELGKKFYLVANIQPHNAKVDSFLKDMAPLIEMGPDALIMSDPGLIMLVREAFPEMPIHLSVQANAINHASVRFWARQGIERVILSRELSLNEIAVIRERCPDVELEVFVHGALCMAFSGRCLLSGYINRRDPNQGACTNACRWQYQAAPASEDGCGQAVQLAEPRLMLLEEKSRPGELMAAEEDEHGSYIFNSKDLRAVQHVAALTAMGVHSLKIEGRTKSHYYVARTAQIYRRAIDDAVAGLPFDDQYLQDLEHLANRGYTEGFLNRHGDAAMQNYQSGAPSSPHQFVGEVTSDEGGWLQIAVKNRFALGDQLLLVTPKGNHGFILETLQNHKGEPMAVAPGDGHQVQIPRPEGADGQMGLLVRLEA